MPLGVELRPRDDDLPRIRAALGRHDVARVRVRAGAGSLLSRQTFDGDARYYMRLGTNGVLAFRARGYKSWGEFPGYIYFGGNSELRGYDYLEFLGNKGFFTNAELRFPVIEAALTPIGVVGGLRGVFFFNLGAAGYEGVPMTVATSKPITSAAARLHVRSDVAEPGGAGLRPSAHHLRVPARGRPRVVRLRPRDLRARIPDPLRLVLADAVQQGLGRLRVLLPGRADGHDAAASGCARQVQRLDRIRFLDA